MSLCGSAGLPLDKSRDRLSAFETSVSLKVLLSELKAWFPLSFFVFMYSQLTVKNHPKDNP